MQDTNLHNLKAPWIKLYSLSNETDFLSSKFDEYFDAVDAVDNFNDLATEEVRGPNLLHHYLLLRNCLLLFLVAGKS